MQVATEGGGRGRYVEVRIGDDIRNRAAVQFYNLDLVAEILDNIQRLANQCQPVAIRYGRAAQVDGQAVATMWIDPVEGRIARTSDDQVGAVGRGDDAVAEDDEVGWLHRVMGRRALQGDGFDRSSQFASRAERHPVELLAACQFWVNGQQFQPLEAGS